MRPQSRTPRPPLQPRVFGERRDPSATGENSYEAPRADLGGAVGVRSGLRKDLRDVAFAQKGILICILLQFVLIAAQYLVPPNVKIAVALAMIVSGLVATVFVFLLSMKVYNV